MPSKPFNFIIKPSLPKALPCSTLKLMSRVSVFSLKSSSWKNSRYAALLSSETISRLINVLFGASFCFSHSPSFLFKLGMTPFPRFSVHQLCHSRTFFSCSFLSFNLNSNGDPDSFAIQKAAKYCSSSTGVSLF